jgi:hypothetical protein
MSGWATVTVKANSSEDAEELREAFSEITKKDRDARICDLEDAEVEVLDWGYGSSESVSVLKQNAGLWSEAIVMECNDTSDSGSGSYYTSDGTRRGVSEEATASGYEGARGHDAAGELRGKAGFSPYMR